MALPKIEYPITKIMIGNKQVNFRPMLVKDEKILLTARESKNDGDVFTAVKQVVNNCSVDPDFDVDKLPIFELEFAFLRLRIASIGDSIKLSYRDTEDELDYDFTVNLEDIKIVKPDPAPTGIINATPEMGLTLRYPPASLYSNSDFLNAEDEKKYFEEMLLACIINVFDEQQVYDAKVTPREELLEFVDTLPSTCYKEIQNFLSSVPHMEYVIKYTNKNGTEREIPLRTLTDFFML